MSRSYKKSPIITDSAKPYKFQPSPKTIANRIVRRKLKSELNQGQLNDFINIPTQKHSTFKKYYESYDICDFKFRLEFSNSPIAVEPYSEKVARKYYKK